MAFSPEDKVTWSELAPSLQNLLNSKANISDIINNSTIILSGDASGSATLPYKNTTILQTHISRTDLAYNIPTRDVGGNCWVGAK